MRNYLTGRIEITSQNHGFAVEPPAVVREALEQGSVVGDGGVAGLRAEDMMLDSDFGPVQITHLNLNDGTVEGLRLLDVPAYSRAVPPGGRSRTARQPLPVPPVRGSDARRLAPPYREKGRACSQ